jgi:hypothetical protein
VAYIAFACTPLRFSNVTEIYPVSESTGTVAITVPPSAVIDVGLTVGAAVNSAIPSPFVDDKLPAGGKLAEVTQSNAHDVAVSVVLQTRSPQTSPVMGPPIPGIKPQEKPIIVEKTKIMIGFVLNFILSS